MDDVGVIKIEQVDANMNSPNMARDNVVHQELQRAVPIRDERSEPGPSRKRNRSNPSQPFPQPDKQNMKVKILLLII